MDRAARTAGDSVLVVGDKSTLKIHVHTDEPERATGLFEEAGGSRASTSPTCTSRSSSARAACSRRSPARGVLSVVSGDGMRELFEGLGAHALDGGPP